MTGIATEIKESFKRGNCTTRLIYVNLAVFIIVRLVAVCLTIGKTTQPTAFLEYLMMPSAWRNLLHALWTPFSYMFLHYDFIHLIFNLLGLYYFGKLFSVFFNEKQLFGVYLLGGLSGAALFAAVFNIFGFPQSYLLGASASVLAIMTAAAAYAPNLEISLTFVGNVRLKYVALTWILIDLLSVTSFNAGGHIAHLGGILFGFLFAKQLQNGHDLTKFLNRFIDRLWNLFRRRPKMKVVRSKPVQQMNDQEYNKMAHERDSQIDKILDKIKRSGYNSLTKEEKELIFKQKR